MALKIKLILLAISIAGSFIVGFQISNWRNDAGLLKAAQALDKSETALEDKTDELALQEAKHQVEQIRLRSQFDKERTLETQKPIYRKCVATDDGMQLYNRAAEGLTGPASSVADPGQ